MTITNSYISCDPFVEFSLNELNEKLVEKDEQVAELTDKVQKLENEIKAIYSYLNINLYKLSAEIKTVSDFNRLYTPFKENIEIHTVNSKNCLNKGNGTKENSSSYELEHNDPTKINVYIIEYEEEGKICNRTIDYFTVNRDKLLFNKFPTSVSYNLKLENGSLYVDALNYDSHISIVQALGQGDFNPDLLFIH
jgi:hypothetical protein